MKTVSGVSLASVWALLGPLLFGCVGPPVRQGSNDGGVAGAFTLENSGPMEVAPGLGGLACDPTDPPVLTLEGSVLAEGYCGRVAQTGCGAFSHSGLVGAIDVMADEGWPVVAPISGTIVAVRDTVPERCSYESHDQRDLLREANECPSFGTDYGNLVAILAPTGVVSIVVAHLQSGSVSVRVGDVVSVGDRIGRVGNTGYSTGAHVHVAGVIPGLEYGAFPAASVHHTWQDQGAATRTGLPAVGDVYCGGTRGCSSARVEASGSTQVAEGDALGVSWCVPGSPERCRVVVVDAETGGELAPTPNGDASCVGQQTVVVPPEWAGHGVEVCATDDVANTACTGTIWVPSLELACPLEVDVGEVANCSYAVSGVPPGQTFRAPLLINGVESGLATGGLVAGDGFFYAPAAPAGVDRVEVCVTAYDTDPVQVSDCVTVAVREASTGCTPAPEVCDGLDNDCDGVVDDNLVCGGAGTNELRIGLGGAWAEWCPTGARVVAWDSDGRPHLSAAGAPLVVELDAAWRGGHVMVNVICQSANWTRYADLAADVGDVARDAGFVAISVRGRDLTGTALVCRDTFTGSGAKLAVPLETVLEGTCPL